MALKDMTMQEMFSQSYLGLANQEFAKSQGMHYDRCTGRSIATCLYRGKYDRKCAIGHLLSDEDYSPELEGVPVSDAMSVGRLSVNRADAQFLIRLQQAHDYCSGPTGMKIALAELARQYNLTVPEVEGALPINAG